MFLNFIWQLTGTHWEVRVNQDGQGGSRLHDWPTEMPFVHWKFEKKSCRKRVFLWKIVICHWIRAQDIPDDSTLGKSLFRYFPVLLILHPFHLSFPLQPSQDKQSGAQSSERTTPSSSISSLGDGPYSPGKSGRSGKSRGNDSDSESEPGGTSPVVPGPVTNGFSSKGNEDPALKEVMSQISSSFPPDQKSEWGGTVKRVFVCCLMFVVSD